MSRGRLPPPPNSSRNMHGKTQSFLTKFTIFFLKCFLIIAADSFIFDEGGVSGGSTSGLQVNLDKARGRSRRAWDYPRPLDVRQVGLSEVCLSRQAERLHEVDEDEEPQVE